ncbi:hypothetical protein DID77_03660 [Candidatus Marinamargulisbacteria bacterium SCGC AG-439-L15]|nr:hypothetical protein DID77_03660 [Candidatus Marinamargulisbacteria bacterium SCGC AG-439-L15]
MLKNDDDFIDEMKEAIRESSHIVSKRVMTSALSFIKKKDWSAQDNKDMDRFFNKKIPQVIADETLKELSEVLGLDIKL